MSENGMPRRRLGDLEVSAIGLGCNNFGRRVGLDATRAVVDAAVDAGVEFLDTADVYGGPDKGASETLLGEVLEGRRDRVVLATKFGNDMEGANGEEAGPRGSRAYIRQAVEASLRRLRTDRIDLYQYHRPDGETPIEETLGALDELVREGVIRAAGLSNFGADALREAAAAVERDGLTGFVSLQNEYSLLKRAIESDVIPECDRRGVAVLPYFPLASGLLTGKYRRGEDAPAGTRLAGRDQIADNETWDRLDQLAEFAEERGIEPIDVSIGWLLAQPGIASVIAGATKPEQIRRNAEAGRWQPSEEDRAQLDAVFQPATDMS
jgi:aryl-alcohol dehydrogenase-like predicted oxidoreductase